MQKNKIYVFVDGAARGNPGPAGIGVVLVKEGKIIKEISESIGQATNNIAEYTALLQGMEEVLFRGYRNAHFHTDSELLAKQMNGEYKVKSPGLKPLFLHALSLRKRFNKFSISHVNREKNKKADELANQGIDQKYKS